MRCRAERREHCAPPTPEISSVLWQRRRFANLECFQQHGREQSVSPVRVWCTPGRDWIRDIRASHKTERPRHNQDWLARSHWLCHKEAAASRTVRHLHTGEDSVLGGEGVEVACGGGHHAGDRMSAAQQDGIFTSSVHRCYEYNVHWDGGDIHGSWMAPFHHPFDSKFVNSATEELRRQRARVGLAVQPPDLGSLPNRTRLLFKHFPKAGGSFAKGVLANCVPGSMQLLLEHEHLKPEHQRNAFVIASVREPCAAYVSLWAYGKSAGNSSLFHRRYAVPSPSAPLCCAYSVADGPLPVPPTQYARATRTGRHVRHVQQLPQRVRYSRQLP